RLILGEARVLERHARATVRARDLPAQPRVLPDRVAVLGAAPVHEPLRLERLDAEPHHDPAIALLEPQLVLGAFAGADRGVARPPRLEAGGSGQGRVHIGRGTWDLENVSDRCHASTFGPGHSIDNAGLAYVLLTLVDDRSAAPARRVLRGRR